ncbi:MAG: ATP-binding protein [Clostridium sp.]
MKRYICRNKELESLQKQYESDESSLVVIYGRRRIGKTALIKKFIDNKPSIYFLATEESEKENANNFKNIMSEKINNPLLNSDVSFGFKDLFNILKTSLPKEKMVVVIDEFQYLGKVNSAFPSVFQGIWDNILKDENIMVILCGSLIGMMEEQTLSYSSPLYGRRTGQIKMKQIDFIHYGEFFENKSFEELVELYSVTGGVPKYIETFKKEKNIFTAIENSILEKDSYLYEEPIFLLEKEVGDVGTYFSIIKTIAAGNHKLSKIATTLGVNQSNLTKYISTLINLDILEREIPITEEQPEKSKKGLYYIKDNFLEFWFKFVYPYRSYIEMEATEFVLEKIKRNFIDNHVSFVYEKICQELLWQMNFKGELPFHILKLGRYWDNTEEIDIVGLNDIDKTIIFGECKYLNKVVGVDIYIKLKEKAKKVKWNTNKRTDYFIIFSKEGYSKELIELSKNNSNNLKLF